ncbi:MAG: hypothetical protein U1D25_03840 [Hydrogenophaga sp.]|uniref:hypothetical protein n=1 Tax=Hydrogenophaga sp. TaxID=1904254 RepID=UPI002754963D|nr:hypothetical protein [Hydrogenophaga sp.]MDP2418329.1 hypothetical protein [Hydrogenophaga sp.]MDZ4187232.1 hypothetical protein [Hydrogenophaga sp.]
MVLQLAGCGGGASTPDAGTPAPGTPTANELAQAASAELRATVLTETTQVNLTWNDTVQGASAYRVERLQTSTQWSSLQTIPAQGGSGQALGTTTAATAQGTYRVLAVLASRTVVLRTGSGAESVVVQTSTTAPSNDNPPLDAAWLASVGIRLGPDDALSEPVSGTVPLSLTMPSGWAPRSVTWYVNLQTLPTAGSVATGFATSWNTQGLVDGSYLITARVEVQPDSFVEWRRTVQVRATTVAASISVSGTQGVVTVQVGASSTHGIASVRTWLNGTDLGTLTSPNGCSGRDCTTLNAFVYSLDTRTLPAGAYTLTSTVTDTRGDAVTVSRSVNFANPPVLAITQPRDGQWVHGQLLVEGSSTAEHSVSTRITLGSVPVATSTAPSWSTTYSLAGVSAGSYLLTVRATDAQGLSSTQQRTVVVVSDPLMVQAPLFDMGASARLIAAQGGDVLWQAGDGTVNRRKANGDNVEMSGSSGLRYANDWQLDQGHVVAYGQGDDCASPLFVCVYAWGPDGQRRNLSALVGGSRSYDQHPVLRFPWVMWIAQSSTSRYALQHLSPPAGAVAQYQIAQPASVTGTLGNWQYDLAVSPQVGGPDELTAFFWGTLSDSSSPVGPRADVFRWDSSSPSTQALTASDAQQVYVQTDGQRVAWQKRAPGSVDAPYHLQVAPAGATTTTAATTLSTDMTRFVLNDGLLAWHEGVSGAVTGQRLMVHTGTEAVTLSTDRTASLLAVAGSSVVWSQGGKLYAWRDATGARLLLDVPLGGLVSDGTAVYMASGQQGSVYRLVLP